jgi:hypothetical protein
MSEAVAMPFEFFTHARAVKRRFNRFRVRAVFAHGRSAARLGRIRLRSAHRRQG